MVIYFLCVVFAVVISFLLFPDHIIITKLSLVPIVGILSLAFQAAQCRSLARGESEWDLNYQGYSARETDKSKTRIAMKWHSLCKTAVIPLLFVLIFFFDGTVKSIATVAIYILSHLPIRLLVKWECSKSQEKTK